MKIICIGRNYTEHIEELQNEKPKDPVIFLKPDTALLPKKQPLPATGKMRVAASRRF